MTSGIKLDDGKPRVGLLFKDFPRALLEVARVATMGAAKYSDHGWETVTDKETRYADAEGRHLLQGYIEDFDVESGISHKAHKAWNALIVLELALRKQDDDQSTGNPES